MSSLGSGFPTPRASPVKDSEDSRGGASGEHWELSDAGGGGDVTFCWYFHYAGRGIKNQKEGEEQVE